MTADDDSKAVRGIVESEVIRNLKAQLGRANSMCRIRFDRIRELEAQLEAIGAGGVGPLMHPAEQQASVGYRRAIMGFGRVAVGGCKAADNQMPGIIYLDMGGEQREPDMLCDDLFQPGTAADPSKILACIHFSTRASVWQTIDVLYEILDSEFGAATSPEGGS